MTRLWPLVLSTVALGINSYVIAGILPRIAVSLRTSQGAVGLGVTAFTAAYALTAPWLPGLLTRTGTTRRALSTALTVFTAGSAITALSPSPRVFLVARARQRDARCDAKVLCLTPVAPSFSCVVASSRADRDRRALGADLRPRGLQLAA